MKIQKIILNNIRNFSNSNEFDFKDTVVVNTISGKNGSGKSTIFKSLLLAQKAFFCNQIEDNEIIVDSIGVELAKLFTSKESSIELHFKFDDNADLNYVGSFKIICNKFNQSKVEWVLICSDKDLKDIKKHWNLKNPRNLVFYIDSNKSFIETDISYDNISISGQTESSSLILNTILNPERIFTNTYSTLIRGYLHERLVPAKPRKDLYFLIAKVLLKELMPKVQLSNFSGIQFVNQFVLLGKSSSGKHNNYYDVRNFSSGEKVLFYSLLFITYVKGIGMLVIDEPENHFHEDLLVRFVRILSDIAKSQDYYTYISDLFIKHKQPLSKDIKKAYSDYSLSQIFFLTHSKNLIYNNLTNGANFYVDNGFKEIKYQDLEQTLRVIGISSIYSKVLFVEGSTDTAFFDTFFNEYNVRIHPLKGCEQVIDTYRKVKNIKNFLFDTHFCFIIDRDTRSDDEIKKLRNEDITYFDEHFIVLERHEFENYLLEGKIFYDVIINHNRLTPSLLPMQADEIDEKISDLVKPTREIVFRKHLAKLNGNSIGKLNETFRKKNAVIDNLSDYDLYMDGLFATIDIKDFLKSEFHNNYITCSKMYDNANWDAKWKTICDGKAASNIVISHFASYLQISNKRLLTEVKEAIFTNKSYEVNEIIEEVIDRFKVSI